MSGLPYYKAYPRDFIEGTIGMPFETKCAYRVILDLIYMQGGNLPDDARYISGLLGCSVRKWKSIRHELLEMGKIKAENDQITSDTCSLWIIRARKDDARPSIPESIRSAVWERDGQKCQYCGCEEGPFHLDHITPWSLGGKHTIENLTVSCAQCNWSKGGKTLVEWRGRQ